MSNIGYFAAREAKETADVLITKVDSWYNNVSTNGYLDKVKDMWLAYHGARNGSVNDAHKITFSGEQGELVNLHVNHIGNIAQHILTMITSSRPTFQARATNTDYKSLAQTKLANNLLDYYMREKRMEKYLTRAVEYSIVMGSGYVKMDWNATSGEIYDYNEDTNTPIYEGDVEFSNLSPYDVIFDTSKETSDDHVWLICRTFKNKYDIAAKYPELKSEIEGLSTKSDNPVYRFDMLSTDTTDDVPVYEFYHKRTEAMPEGRYLLFLGKNIILMDTPLPYRSIPVYRIAPRDILGTPYGYSPLFDLLPIQDSINSLYSTILTNQHAFGVQNIYVPRGADISVKALEGGLNVIEGNSNAGKPESLNLTQTPVEIFNFINKLESQMETLSGVNSVARGNPEASLKSGTALALVQSMALQFISGLQQQYVRMVEDVGTGLITILRDFASVPRIAIIAGKSNQAYIQQEFSGDDLSQINRVIVDMGNAISKTTAGRLQMASELIQYGVIKSPEQYMTVLNTGQLEIMTDDAQNEQLLIKGENEKMSQKVIVPALAIDQHLLHIKQHRAILSDPDIRMDDELNGIVLNHINEHINFLRTVDPALLMAIGEQPLGPAPGSPPNLPPPSNQVNQSAQPTMPLPPGMTPEQMPNMPNMPQVNPALLPNPELQQQSMGNVGG